MTGQCHRYTPYEMIPRPTSGLAPNTDASHDDAPTEAMITAVATAMTTNPPRYIHAAPSAATANSTTSTATAGTTTARNTTAARPSTGGRPTSSAPRATPMSSPWARVSVPK